MSSRRLGSLLGRLGLLSLLAVLSLLSLGVAGSVARAAALSDGPLHWTDPLRDSSGQPLSCPDPSVARWRAGRFRYVLFCTSDNARNAFPIWQSPDLVHWRRLGYMFPYKHDPSWAEPADGRTRRGIYWAPSVTRIDGRWTVYFSASYDADSDAVGSAKLNPYTMVIGVATSRSLTGPWHSRLLHYPGQFNADNPANAQEVGGGDIDPGPLYDPRTKRRYLFWAQQREEVWEAPMSADGLSVGPSIRFAFGHSEPWECDPSAGTCTVEGPQPFYRDGRVYVMYSGASTWDATYVVGVASAQYALDPATPFVKDATPILRAGNGFRGPGGESDPVVGPNGQSMILYHATTRVLTRHSSAARVLMLGTLTWLDGFPLIDGGVAR